MTLWLWPYPATPPAVSSAGGAGISLRARAHAGHSISCLLGPPSSTLVRVVCGAHRSARPCAPGAPSPGSSSAPRRGVGAASPPGDVGAGRPRRPGRLGHTRLGRTRLGRTRLGCVTTGVAFLTGGSGCVRAAHLQWTVHGVVRAPAAAATALRLRPPRLRGGP
jgi:hypothetical protein